MGIFSEQSVNQPFSKGIQKAPDGNYDMVRKN